MELLFAIFAALAIWYFWGPRRKKRPSPPASPARPRPAGPSEPIGRGVASSIGQGQPAAVPAYAWEIDGDGRHPRTREQVESMFSGAREELPRLKTVARKAMAAAKRFEDDAYAGKKPPSPEVAPFKQQIAKARFIGDECAKALDSLIFESERGAEKFSRIYESITEFEDDISSAVEQIQDTAQGIAAGEYDDVPKPSKR